MSQLDFFNCNKLLKLNNKFCAVVLREEGVGDNFSDFLIGPFEACSVNFAQFLNLRALNFQTFKFPGESW